METETVEEIKQRNSICNALEALVHDITETYDAKFKGHMELIYTADGYIREFSTIRISTGRRLGVTTGIMQYIYHMPFVNGTRWKPSVLIIAPFDSQLSNYRVRLKPHLDCYNFPKMITAKQAIDYMAGTSICELVGTSFDMIIVDNYSTIKTIEGFEEALAFLCRLHFFAGEVGPKTPILIKAG